MTGQIAFARTLRALDADDFRGSTFGLLLALAVLALWTWWMFAARIPQYEVADNVILNPATNSATANFPPTSNVHPGQPAQITTGGAAIPAEVANVRNEPSGLILVSFNLFRPPPAISHEPSATARASVEVTSIPPASVVLRSLR